MGSDVCNDTEAIAIGAAAVPVGRNDRTRVGSDIPEFTAQTGAPWHSQPGAEGLPGISWWERSLWAGAACEPRVISHGVWFDDCIAHAVATATGRSWISNSTVARNRTMHVPYPEGPRVATV